MIQAYNFIFEKKFEYECVPNLNKGEKNFVMTRKLSRWDCFLRKLFGFHDDTKLAKVISNRLEYTVKFCNDRLKPINIPATYDLFEHLDKLINKTNRAYQLHSAKCFLKGSNLKNDLFNELSSQALRSGEWGILKLLLTEKVIIDDQQRWFIFNEALEEGKFDSLELLFQKNENYPFSKRLAKEVLSRLVASNASEPKIIDLFIKNQLETSEHKIAIRNVLHEACLRGKLEIIKFFIKNKQSDINERGDYQETYLHRACAERNNAIAQYLIEENADVNIRDHKDNTPLDIIIKTGNIELIDFLLNKNKINPTPLQKELIEDLRRAI